MLSSRRFQIPVVILLASFSLAAAQTNSGDPDSLAILQSIKYQAQQRPTGYGYVQELSDKFGPRLTGTAQTAAACNWAMQKMKRAGLQDIHLEPWRLGRAWQRGIASAQLTMPFHLGLNIASYGWVGSTKPGGVETDVVLVNADSISDEIRLHSNIWRNKILFLAPVGAKHVNPIRAFSQLGSLLNAAGKVHAVAVITSAGRPGTMLTHTGPAAFRDSFFPTPVVDIAPEQQQLLLRILTAKQKVRMKIDVENVSPTGSILSSNVVGDLPGSEHPEEIVLICAHLDSWDLGTGSIDDGFGVAGVLAAADAIVSQHIRAKRTLRFVLFTGEEEGLLGSLAYVRAHKVDLKNIVCAFTMDWGSGPITKLPLAGHDELVGFFQHFIQTVQDFGEVKVDTSYLSYTDGYAFTLAGIPGIAPLQNSPNYALVGHSAADTLDKVDRKSLMQDTAILAAMAFWAANYPTRLGTPWSAEKTAATLSRDNQKTMLELFGLWRFGVGKSSP